METNDTPHSQLLTVDEVAHKLQVPVGTIYQWRHRHYGPAGFRVGRHLRFRLDVVERWIGEQEAAEATAA